MVRVAIVALGLTPSFAEDVYYHTQLLQTKMNPQKAAVGADGDVKDDMVLFQKAAGPSSSSSSSYSYSTGSSSPSSSYSTSSMDPVESACEECAVGCIFPNGLPTESTSYKAQPVCFDPDSCMADAGFMGCFEGCLGDDHPIVEGLNACRQHYPDSVMMCMECGMYCMDDAGCDPKDCGESAAFLGCHPTCMAHHPDNKDADVVDGVKLVKEPFESILLKQHLGKFFKEHAQLFQTDSTDLMQTQKHVKQVLKSAKKLVGGNRQPSGSSDSTSDSDLYSSDSSSSSRSGSYSSSYDYYSSQSSSSSSSSSSSDSSFS